MIWFWVPALLNASPFLFSLVQCDVTGEKEEQPGVDAEVAATSKRRNSLLWSFRWQDEKGMFVWSVAPLMDKGRRAPCSDDYRHTWADAKHSSK